VVAVAVKQDGERQAYAIGWMLYAALPDSPFADASLELSNDAYEVTRRGRGRWDRVLGPLPASQRG
jgi:hypothetical protein